MTVKVIIADDHPITRKGLSSVLSSNDELEIVAETSDGSSTVAAAIRLHPDVVIMDIAMPGMDGLTATRKIVSLCPSVSVLGLSIYTNRHYVLEMLKAGARGYLPKDCDEEEITKAIFAVCKGNIYLTEKMASVVASDYVAIATGQEEGKNLSPRENQVLSLLADGKTSREIAEMLHISPKTVESHRSRIMEKLGLFSVAELARYAERAGLVID